MPRATLYFSYEKKEKQCNGPCKLVKPLTAFRRSNNATEDEKLSAFYSYQCTECHNDRAREYQRKKSAEKKK